MSPQYFRLQTLFLSSSVSLSHTDTFFRPMCFDINEIRNFCLQNGARSCLLKLFYSSTHSFTFAGSLAVNSFLSLCLLLKITFIINLNYVLDFSFTFYFFCRLTFKSNLKCDYAKLSINLSISQASLGSYLRLELILTIFWTWLIYFSIIFKLKGAFFSAHRFVGGSSLGVAFSGLHDSTGFNYGFGRKTLRTLK